MKALKMQKVYNTFLLFTIYLISITNQSKFTDSPCYIHDDESMKGIKYVFF